MDYNFLGYFCSLMSAEFPILRLRCKVSVQSFFSVLLVYLSLCLKAIIAPSFKNLK